MKVEPRIGVVAAPGWSAVLTSLGADIRHQLALLTLRARDAQVHANAPEHHALFTLSPFMDRKSAQQCHSVAILSLCNHLAQCFAGMWPESEISPAHLQYPLAGP